MPNNYFITGATGCIGSWIVKILVERGDNVTVFDVSNDTSRLLNIMTQDDVARVRLATGDVSDGEQVRRAIGNAEASRLIHLAGLQVPTCKASPTLGARVNVVGTLNVFEAARELKIGKLVYASSAAVFGMSEDDAAIDENVKLEPATHYGVFKQANEANARIYFQDNQMSSIGLRPLTVYGVNRDAGLTSDPTKAMKAAILNRPFHIRFTGKTDFQLVRDTAQTFVRCADADVTGAYVFNLHGDTVEVTRFIEIINHNLPDDQRNLITCDGAPLPIAPHLDDSLIRRIIGDVPHTPLAEGIKETMLHFQKLRDEGRLGTHDLET